MHGKCKWVACVLGIEAWLWKWPVMTELANNRSTINRSFTNQRFTDDFNVSSGDKQWSCICLKLIIKRDQDVHRSPSWMMLRKGRGVLLLKNLQPVAADWLTTSSVAKLKEITTPDFVQQAFSDLSFPKCSSQIFGWVGVDLLVLFNPRRIELQS